MSSLQRSEFHDEAREVCRLLTQLASQSDGREPSEFLRDWDDVEPRVLSCLRQVECEEGAASGRIERLRNLTAEVGASAKGGKLRKAALCTLARSFGGDIAVQSVGGARRPLTAASPRRDHELRRLGGSGSALLERTRGSAAC